MTAVDVTGTKTVASTIGVLFRAVHHQMREQVKDLSEEAINWKPHPEANSIAVLVVHTLGSEKEAIGAVRGISSDRDRPAEFEVTAKAADLVALLELADADLDKHIQALTAEDLTAMRPRGDRPARPGLEWLIQNYGHAREHLAQIELTRQLYSGRD